MLENTGGSREVAVVGDVMDWSRSCRKLVSLPQENLRGSPGFSSVVAVEEGGVAVEVVGARRVWDAAPVRAYVFVVVEVARVTGWLGLEEELSAKGGFFDGRGYEGVGGKAIDEDASFDGKIDFVASSQKTVELAGLGVHQAEVYAGIFVVAASASRDFVGVV
jgi:hypothetical protein